MALISLTPKNRQKIRETTLKISQEKLEETSKLASSFKPPKEWAEFARMTSIRSGQSIIPFDPYWFQEELIKTIETHYGTVVAKTRQLGATEAILNYFLWRALSEPGFCAVCFSKTQNDTSALAKRLRTMIFPLQSKGLVATVGDSLTDIEFTNGGRIIFRPSTATSARGLPSISAILYDEAAFVEEIEQIYSASVPCCELLGDDARLIFISTPNGRSGFFWKLLSSWNLGVDVDQVIKQIRNFLISLFAVWEDNSNWAKVLIHWKAHPVFSQQENYLDNIKKKKKLTDDILQQEYNLGFDESEKSVFPYHLIEQGAIGDFEEYDESCRYFCGLDCAGIGDDYTVFQVFSFKNGVYNLAAMYRERKASAERNIHYISELIKAYNPSAIGIEVTGGIGQIYLEKLTDLHPEKQILDIKTTSVSKPVMINRMLLALEMQCLTFPPGIITDEMRAFERQGEDLKQMGASAGNHDDTVMAAAIALCVTPFAMMKTPDRLPVKNFQLFVEE